MNLIYVKFIVLSVFYIGNLSTLSNGLINQGEVSVTFDDLDGYSYTIPKDTRIGFFNSPDRIDSTLQTILKIKHVVNYAKKEDLLNDEKVKSYVSKYLEDNKSTIKEYNLTDFEFLKVKNFAYNKMVYTLMHHYVKNSIQDEDVIQLANEKYLLNKESYFIENEMRNLQYITLNFNDENKNEIVKLSQSIIKDSNIKNFEELENLYSENKNVKFIKDINKFYFNEKFKDFSEFVFSSSKVGFLKKYLEIDDTFVIVDIKEITPSGYLPFEKVKPLIINSLKKEKATLKFSHMITKLTKDEIIINEDAIISLKTRYKTK